MEVASADARAERIVDGLVVESFSPVQLGEVAAVFLVVVGLEL